MALLGLLRRLRLEDFPGDGPDVENISQIWRKHFNLDMVETRERRFKGCVVTDGSSVTVLMIKPSCMVTPCDESADDDSSRRLKLTRYSTAEAGHAAVASVEPHGTVMLTPRRI
eukprot:CAMPEP_0175080816 /NCGR_PEP_ID=MMETSP0052_2-20121109/25758_1 /TAXON_ID=51329 ORGANISM="Polytomella parva, Strain SAG 63-3" /NCGR_SAMPLE_ID=MMETSP0052_2 /ASSEMBLY_ACC=CAM_ASM_000194 /LENGTH=113 /DNA_ID=CAMNT_0016351639 /DNA_START=1214 /DNA_END=1555 /DNA_ORIENTATION=+